MKSFTFRNTLFRIICITTLLFLSSSFKSADLTVPVINSSSVGSITTSSFQLTVNVNLGPSTVFWVVTTSSTAPSDDQVRLGLDEFGVAGDDSGNISISAGQVNSDRNSGGSIAGLTSDTQYYIHFFAEDNGTQTDDSPVQTIAAKTLDNTDPTVTSVQIINNNGTNFTFQITVNDEGTVYYVVTDSGTTPTEAQIESGTDENDVAAIVSGTIAVTANTPATAAISGLLSNTKYRVHYFPRDEAGNDPAPATRNEPIRNSSSINLITTTGFTLNVEYDMDGTNASRGVYYVVTSSSTQPTHAQIQAGQNESGAAAITSGDFNVSANIPALEAITGLSPETTYYVHFIEVNNSGSESEIRTETATTLDANPPVVSVLNPIDGFAEVDISNNTFIVTFNENISMVPGGASSNNDRVRLFENGVMVEDIDRNDPTVGTDGSVVTSGATLTVTFFYTLLPNTNYYILIGNNVIEDVGGNNFAGFSATTDWNFTTSTVTVNNASNNICSGSFQSIGDIVISEGGISDFNNDGTLWLDLTNTTDFAFSTTGLIASETGSDISITSVTASLSRITLTYTRSGGTTKDVITISGIKVYATGGSASTTIRRSGGTASQDGNNGTGGSSLTYATINTGASPPSAPVLAAAQDLTHCAGENISAKTLSVVDQPGATFRWYSNASLTTLVASSVSPDVSVNVNTELGLATPAIAGVYKFYVVALTSCQSSSYEVTITVSPNPVSDAGADLTGVNAVCEGSTITLGGTPTLVTPSAPGAYTYAWSELTATYTGPAIASTSNPQVTLPNSGAANLNHQFQVLITDANGCQHTDVKNVEVRREVNVSLTQPSSTNFSPASPAQTLEASPSGGIFSGTGVVQTGTAPNTYKFDPATAYNSSLPLPQNYNIYYSVTDGNGCASGTVQVATFTLSNALFSTLAVQYCGSEEPYSPNNGIELSVSVNAYNQAKSSVDYWNNYGRFFAMNIPQWNSGASYGPGQQVKFSLDGINFELYQYIFIFPSSGIPPSDPSRWMLIPNRAKVEFNGTIKNRYETFYGGNVGNPTMRQKAGTYTVDVPALPPLSDPVYNYFEIFTNPNYNDCPNCSYVYPSLFIEFINTADRIYKFYEYNPGNYYYPKDIVRNGTQIYRCLQFNYPFFQVTPGSNAAYWEDITSQNYANFSDVYDGSTAGFYSSGQFVTINRNPVVSFSGFTSPYVNPNTFCNKNEVYQLTGNFPGGNFFVSSDGTGGAATYINGVPGEGLGLFNGTPGPGGATFNPGSYYPAAPGAGVKTVYIKYVYDGGQNGSSGQDCVGETVQIKNINPLPALSFAPATPPALTEFCYDGANVTLKTNETTNVTFSGLGVVNGVGGNGHMVPTNAYKSKEIVDGVSYQPNPVTIIITASRNDANNCVQSITRDLVVRGIPVASFGTTPIANREIYCYEDAPQTLQGGQGNFAFWKITYQDTPGLYSQTFGSLGSGQQSIPFVPKDIYENGVTNGASATITQTFKIDYTVFENNALQCQNTISKTFSIGRQNPQNIVETDPGSIFCSNGTVVTLTGNVSPGIVNKFDISTNALGPFTDGIGTGIVNTTTGKAVFNPGAIYGAVTTENTSKAVYLRYGYQSPSCTAPEYVIEQVDVYSPPDIDFSAASPPDEDVFCQVSTEEALSTDQTVNVTLFGLGITDNGGGQGTFNPFTAYKAREAALNQTQTTQQSFDITAKITYAPTGCTNTSVIQYRVQPIPPANFTPDKQNYCKEEIVNSNNWDGAQVNAFYTIEYLTTPAPYSESFGSLGSPQPDITFTPLTFFNNSISQGGDSKVEQKFAGHYTAYDAFGCTNTITKLFNIAPIIEVAIAGIDSAEVLCSNDGGGTRTLELSPSGGRLWKSENNGPLVELTSSIIGGQYDLPLPLNGMNYDFTYTVVSGNNCTNTTEKSISVLASPIANFTLTTKCDKDIIPFNAANNSSPANYTWILGTDTIPGQNITKQFPGTGSTHVKLRVEYPASLGVVCFSEKEGDQSIADNPVVDFKFVDICNGDDTQFTAESKVVPLAEVKWSFGDGNPATAYGSFSANVIGADTHSGLTGGKYGTPTHRFTAGSYLVEMIGKSSLGCDDTVQRQVIILPNLSPTPIAAYDINTIAGGGGWAVEDLNGNTSWEFAPTSRGTVTHNSWTTDAAGTYRSDDQSYVNSPCFNITAFSRPLIALDYWSDVPGGRQDGTVLQYSINGGRNWTNVGAVSTGLEWFNVGGIAGNPGLQSVGQIGWSREGDLKWSTAKHSLDIINPIARQKVRFRVAFGSNKDALKTQDGFGFANVKIEERNRTILAENFTNLTSMDNNTKYQDFRAVNKVFNTDELVKIQYHTSVAGADQLNADNPVDQNARAAFYGVTQVNRAYLDGGFEPGTNNPTFMGNWLNNYFSLRSLVSSPLDIAVTLPPTPADKFNVQASILTSTPILTGRYNVFIAIAEKDIMGQLYVLRKFLPDASGTPLTARTASSTQIISASYDLRHISKDASGNFKPIAVIVFVQDIENDKDVLQAYVMDVPAPANNVITGAEGSLDQHFGVYPSPADKEMTISLPEAAKKRTAMQVFDQMGKVVNESTFEKGDSQKTISTINLAGGVYLIQIQAQKGILRRKVMVVHDH